MIALSCTTVITVVQICIQRGLAAGVRYFILAHMYKIINFIWGGREGKEVTFHEMVFFFSPTGLRIMMTLHRFSIDKVMCSLLLMVCLHNCNFNNFNNLCHNRIKTTRPPLII